MRDGTGREMVARASRLLAALVVLAYVWAPRIAHACPSCGAQRDRLSSTLKLVGAFMLLPFLVTGVILKVIRSAPPDRR